MNDAYLSAREAAARLGISLATLYAYVSRGKVDSRPGPDGRSREYRADDIERLIDRRQAGRGAAQGAAHSLTWGLPVLETRITLIRPHGHYYRGQSAIALARDGATLEEVAHLLWDCGDDDPFQASPTLAWSSAVQGLLRHGNLPPLERTTAAMPLLALAAADAHSVHPRQRRAGAARLLRETAALLAAAKPGRQSIHRQLASAWRHPHAQLPELLRCALVVCADHELNASAFAARVAASTGASLHATACAGLAALSGPQHGGATARAYGLLRQALHERRPEDGVRERLRRGDELPGFGHPLYPDGDPRAVLLLERLAAARPRLPGMARIQRLTDAVAANGGRRPSLDFALAAIALLHDQHADAALSLFAAGRMAGWLAHALEQQEAGGLIRPRANYAGTTPVRQR
ncbi:MAG: citrate synthase family protein [Rhodanobacter sp.]